MTSYLLSDVQVVSAGDSGADIQSAIDSLPSGRSAPGLVVAQGDFSLETSISLPSKVLLDLREASLTAVSGLDAPMLVTQVGVSNVGIYGGELDHNGSNQASGQAALWFKNVTNGMVDGVTLANAYDRGIEIDGGENVTVANCRVRDTGRGTGGPDQGTGHPIMFWSGDKSVERRHNVHDCLVSGGPIGYDFGDVRGIEGSNLTAMNVGNNGISTDNCHQITINNFHVDNAGSWGVVVNQREITLSNGVIENSGAKAVHVDASDVSISYVISKLCGGNAFDIVGQSRRVALSDCKAIDPDLRGFRTDSNDSGAPADISFSNCWSVGSGQSEPVGSPGFDLADGNIISVSDCKAFHSWTDGVYINGTNVTVTGGIFKNNDRKDAGHSGVRLGGSAVDCAVTGVRAFDDQSTKTQDSGVSEASGSDYNSVSGCVLRGNASTNLVVSGSNTVTSGNVT